MNCIRNAHLLFRGQALPLLRRLLHGLAEGLGVLHHGLELRVRQHPQQVVQDQNQLGGNHVAVLNLQKSAACFGRGMHYAGGSSSVARINVTWHPDGDSFIFKRCSYDSTLRKFAGFLLLFNNKRSTGACSFQAKSILQVFWKGCIKSSNKK